MKKRKYLNKIILILEVVEVPFLYLFSVISRYCRKKIHIGIGGMPLINSMYHKKAFQEVALEAETFTRSTFFITSNFDKIFESKNSLLNVFAFRLLNLDFVYILFRYECIYSYFSGTLLGGTRFLWRIEPFLLKTAKIKLVLMPYGGDVQATSQIWNLNFKSLLQKDYPQYGTKNELIIRRRKIWQKYADFIIAGCNWVEYLDYWDELWISHFAIDTNTVVPLSFKQDKNKTLKILHAPNHRYIKGTKFIIEAVNRLKKDGFDIELKLIERKPNEIVLDEIKNADIVIDQLIIGWYAMFAIEAMAFAKPVIAYVDNRLLEMYIANDLLVQGELPIINADISNVYEVLRKTIEEVDLEETGQKSRNFVIKHHSLEAIGKKFAQIDLKLFDY